MSNITVAVFANDSSVQKTLAGCFHNASVQVVATATLKHEDANFALEKKPQVAVVMYDGNDAELSFVEHMYVGKEVQAIVVVAKSLTIEAMQLAVAAGANSIIQYSAEKTEIEKSVLDTISKIAIRAKEGTEAGKTLDQKAIAIFGMKGGVGKTTIAVNLAVSLAQAGKRVALADLDLQFGDISVFMDISKFDSIVDAVRDNAFGYKALKTYMSPHYTGVDVLCAPTTPEQADMINPDHVNKIITALKSNYDYTIIDLPPVFDDKTITALRISNEIFSIVNPDVSSLKNSSVSYGVLGSLQCAEKVKYVLTKSGSSKINAKEVAAALNHDISFEIPLNIDDAVAAVNKGVPLVVNTPKSKIAEGIRSYTNGIVPGSGTMPKHVSAKPEKKHKLF